MAYLTAEEFDALFRTFDYTAFRLESRESYAGVSYELEPFRRFVAGEPVDQKPLRPWMRNVREQTAAGKRFARVRVVSEPWSDYSRYGLWQSQVNIEAGEDIRYLARTKAEQIGLPATPPGYDYWLFDSKLLVILHYDAHNDLVREEAVDDPVTVVRHNYWRDAAWHYAVPRDRYVDQVGELVVQPPAGA